MSKQQVQYTLVDGTNMEFILPKGFNDKKNDPSNELISNIFFRDLKHEFTLAFHIIKCRKEQKIIDFEEHFKNNSEPKGGKILKKTNIQNNIDCTNLYLVANRYSPFDINYEYNWIIQSDHNRIIAICSIPKLDLAPELETVLIESFSSVRYQK